MLVPLSTSQQGCERHWLTIPDHVGHGPPQFAASSIAKACTSSNPARTNSFTTMLRYKRLVSRASRTPERARSRKACGIASCPPADQGSVVRSQQHESGLDPGGPLLQFPGSSCRMSPFAPLKRKTHSQDRNMLS